MTVESHSVVIIIIITITVITDIIIKEFRML